MEASHLFCAKQFLFVTEEQVTNCHVIRYKHKDASFRFHLRIFVK